MSQLDLEIGEWRAFVEQSHGLTGGDVEELEIHLRDQIAELTETGLTDDEAFLIAVKRIGSVDEMSREFGREQRSRLWRQFVLPAETERDGDRWGRDALAFALAVAFAIQVARLAAGFPLDESSWFVRNLALLVLPFLAAYFLRRRQLPMRTALATAIPFLMAALVVNVYPFTEDSSTELLVAAHLPVMLWFVVAYPYMSGVLSSHERRMDFVRFTGEWFIYYVLLALGGGVLTVLTVLVLEPAGVDPESLVEWILPSGAAGAVIVAAWLVESKQRVIENMAPVLTMIFTPLFAVMLVVATPVYALTRLGGVFDRELLGIFDALLVVVLGLVIYQISARDSLAPPGWPDRIQLIAVVSALTLDAMVLGVMVARVGELGFTPNRAAVLGLNVVLLINLAVTAWLSARFVTGRGTFHRLERWQTDYLPVYAIWAAAVVVVLPPLFGFA